MQPFGENRLRLPGGLCGAYLAFEVEFVVNESLHPSAPNHRPGFVTASGDTDILMIVVGIVHAMLFAYPALQLAFERWY
jgi:hypothetical protein